MKDDYNSGPRRITEAGSSANMDLKHILPAGLLAPHPGLKTQRELDKNLTATHKCTEKIRGEEEQMIGHNETCYMLAH